MLRELSTAARHCCWAVLFSRRAYHAEGRPMRRASTRGAAAGARALDDAVRSGCMTPDAGLI